jgi:hypothetical protein
MRDDRVLSLSLINEKNVVPGPQAQQVPDVNTRSLHFPSATNGIDANPYKNDGGYAKANAEQGVK